MIECIGESIGLAVEKTAEAAVTANDVAELGAVKPYGFGSLIKERFSSEVAQPQIDALYLSEFPQLNTRPNLFGSLSAEENQYLSLRYNVISKECSEYLCDYGITPWAWQDADLEQRMKMLEKATEIIGKELKLPQDWLQGIKPVAVSGENCKAQASCIAIQLNNGGFKIVGIPTLSVSTDCLTGDYFEAMETIYHEMIHMKQYASIDRVAPGSTTDTRLLDLIKYWKTNNGTSKKRVDYLTSPSEADAWSQGLYFKEVLEAVIQDKFAPYVCRGW